jgi:hypothetical protein
VQAEKRPLNAEDAEKMEKVRELIMFSAPPIVSSASSAFKNG